MPMIQFSGSEDKAAFKEMTTYCVSCGIGDRYMEWQPCRDKVPVNKTTSNLPS